MDEVCLKHSLFVHSTAMQDVAAAICDMNVALQRSMPAYNITSASVAIKLCTHVVRAYTQQGMLHKQVTLVVGS